ncbi:MAG: hypothetical protein B7Y39_16790 [Bdellovibrio sp. 28-41-41]|nr:MAG: hypothetical protein B7Y39_16790 [Bdellovibrio sp. 28-41-41]
MVLLKRWILGTHHGRLDLKHMDSYLEEFVFRINRRTSKVRGLIFQRVIEKSFLGNLKIRHSSQVHMQENFLWHRVFVCGYLEFVGQL